MGTNRGPDHDTAEIAWPNAEVGAHWVEQLERASRHLSDRRLTGVRAIIVAEPLRNGPAEVEAVSALADRLAGERGLAVSIVDRGDHLTVRLSRLVKVNGSPATHPTPTTP